MFRKRNLDLLGMRNYIKARSTAKFFCKNKQTTNKITSNSSEHILAALYLPSEKCAQIVPPMSLESQLKSGSWSVKDEHLAASALDLKLSSRNRLSTSPFKKKKCGSG